MSKGAYFVIQVLWSLVVSSVIWFFTLKNLSFDFYGNSPDTFAALIFFVGIAVYLVFTILYIVLGRKKVRNWSAWMIIVSILICIAIGFLGSQGAIYGSELINKII